MCNTADNYTSYTAVLCINYVYSIQDGNDEKEKPNGKHIGLMHYSNNDLLWARINADVSRMPRLCTHSYASTWLEMLLFLRFVDKADAAVCEAYTTWK